MASIRISRIAESENKWRDIKVLIDGKLVGKIGNGHSQTYELQSGKHSVQAKIDWCSSPILEIDLKKEEVALLQLQSGKLPAILRILFTPKKYLDLSMIKAVKEDLL